MNYISTRDPKKTALSFTDILLAGLAPDGGLYVPTAYPVVSLMQLKEWQYSPYHELATHLFSLFIGAAIPTADIAMLAKKTYTETAFNSPDIVPVRSITDTIYLQDLSSGPSLAFKDMAMQFLGHCLDYELTRQGRELTILGASSGDTVSAAEEAMRGKSRIKVVMLTPKEGMSPFQKAQAGSILDHNIYNVSIEGPFDVCQDLVKAVNADLDFKQQHHIGAVNSINWGRICAQVVYYFKGYLDTVATLGDPLDVYVPSGNFGNVFAGYVAKKMGLPLRKLVVCTNENTVLDTLFQTGVYKQTDMVVTSTPSMDITKASNIERLFFDALDRDPQQCAALMAQFEQHKEADVSRLQAMFKAHAFTSGTSSHAQRLVTMQAVYKQAGYSADPHTAAALHVALGHKDDDVRKLCLETAKPSKFEATVKEALGQVPKRPDRFEGLEDKEQRFYTVAASVDAIKTFIRNI